MLEECYPEGFSWADPSKLWNEQVFQLLDHWRQREEDGMDPIIWNPRCKVLASMNVKTWLCRKRPSTPQPELPLEERTTSLCSTPAQEISDHQSEEENFSEDLQKILDDDSEGYLEDHCSSTPLASPLPQQRVQDSSERGKWLSLVLETQILIIVTGPSANARKGTPRSSFLQRHRESLSSTPDSA